MGNLSHYDNLKLMRKRGIGVNKVLFKTFGCIFSEKLAIECAGLRNRENNPLRVEERKLNERKFWK